MKLIVLSSGSKANGYILVGKKDTPSIEAGVPLKEAKVAMGWNLRPVRGCLISHKHADHAGRYIEYAKAGILVLAPESVFFVPHNRNRPIQPDLF